MMFVKRIMDDKYINQVDYIFVYCLLCLVPADDRELPSVVSAILLE